MRVLINRTDAIGGTLLTMPMAKVIKDKFPLAHITFLVAKKSQDLFDDHPYVDQCIVYPENLSIVKQYTWLKEEFSKNNFDTFFHISGFKLPSAVAFLMGVNYRGGLKEYLSSYLFLNKGLKQFRDMVDMHESLYNIALLSPLGIEMKHFFRRDIRPVIHLEEDKVKQAHQSFLEEIKKSTGQHSQRKLVVIHPGISREALNWPTQSYAQLIIKLEKSFPGLYNYVVSYTNKEDRFIQEMKKTFESVEGEPVKNNLFFLNGDEKGLGHYMGILSQAELFVGPSSGNTHIANALGVKQVGIYSPVKAQSAKRFGPFNRDENVEIVVPESVCGEQYKCAKEACPYFECMSKIEVDYVLERAMKLLKRN